MVLIESMGFTESARAHGDTLEPVSLDILQLNVGLRCNKECSHCHVQAGPDRDEEMSLVTMVRVVELADQLPPSLVDITGGAPELNPNIRGLVSMLAEGGHSVQLRTNLTALLLDVSLIGFFAGYGVKLVASLPCYEAGEVDSVRGEGTFNRSIEVLRLLNETGYGVEPGLELDLVFNPEADFLSPPQGSLEETYHRKLLADFDVEFTHLITITNMPIGRFRENLKESGRYNDYMGLLTGSFNPMTLGGLMCRHQLNVDWDGTVYDCDFNLALGLPMKTEITNINDPEFDPLKLLDRKIVYGEHCFGCTAGQGSSCGGALTGS